MQSCILITKTIPNIDKSKTEILVKAGVGDWNRILKASQQFIQDEASTRGRCARTAIECDIKEKGAAESREMREPAHM
jgi:hypothetical protein